MEVPVGISLEELTRLGEEFAPLASPGEADSGGAPVSPMRLAQYLLGKARARSLILTLPFALLLGKLASEQNHALGCNRASCSAGL